MTDLEFIIGKGSHSDVVESILLETNEAENIKKLDYKIFLEKTTEEIYAYLSKYYINENILDEDTVIPMIIAVGNNFLRQEVANAINKKLKKVQWINAISQRAIIITDRRCIGYGNVICPGVTIQAKASIGNHNIINTNASLDHHNHIRNFVHIAPQCCLCGNITVHDLVFIGSNTTVVPKITIPPVKFIKAGSLIKESNPFIPIYTPNLTNYKNSALDAINSEWISNHGKYIKLATESLKEKVGAKYVILMNNGTTATHCLFLALRHKHPEIKKIYVPNNVYVAACNMVLTEYSLSDVEVLKINEDTWNIDTSEEYLKILNKNSAMLVVHNMGGIINVPRMKNIRPDIIFIEDSCEGLFGKYGDEFVGTSESSLCSSYSFYGNKIITTGEGGAFLTSDETVYEYINKVYSQGMSEEKYLHNVHAYNYRMTNIEAAFLFDQLNDIDTILNNKEAIFNNYVHLLQDIIRDNKVAIQKEEENTSRSNWIFPIRLIGHKNKFSKVLDFFQLRGIDIRPFFYPLDHHHHLKNIKYHQTDPLAFQLHQEIIMIPSSPTLQLNEQKYIVDIIKEYIQCYL